MTAALSPESDAAEAWRAAGTLVRAARERAGLSRTAVASLAGVSTTTLVNLEGGGRTYRGEWTLPGTSDRNLVRIAEAVQVDVAELFATLRREPPAWWIGPKPVERKLSALSGKIDQLAPEDRRYVEELVDRLLGEG